MIHEGIIEFKGTKKGILIYIKPEYDFEFIQEQLIQKIEKAQNFFKGAKIFDIHCETLTKEEKKKLEVLMSTRYKIHMVKPKKKEKKVKAEPENKIFDGIEEGKTKFVQATLRSGQNMKYEGNIVIMGDVNPGAEVEAYGNIIVMGSLRGIAHAGSNGNKDAFVVALHLNPTQLRISDVITRAPDGYYEKPKMPELAKIKGNMVYIEPYLNRNNINKLNK